MSRLSNPNAVRVGITSTWSSSWYENNLTYSVLLYTDIYISEFINGIYYKLKVPATLPIISDVGYDQLLIITKTFFSFKRKKTPVKKLAIFLSIIKLVHRKTLFLLRRAFFKIKKIKYYECYINNFIQKYKFKKKYIFFKKNIYKKNNKNYIKFISNIKFNIRNKYKRYSDIKKNLLTKLLYKKKYTLNNKYKKQSINNNTHIPSIIKSKKIIRKNMVINNKYRKFNNQLYKRIKYRSDRKNKIFRYKNKIKNKLKFKYGNSELRKFRNKIIKYKLWKKNKQKIKKKNKKLMNYKKRIYKSNKNRYFSKYNSIVLFNWLFLKVCKWYLLLIIKSVILSKFILGNIINKKIVNNNILALFNKSNNILISCLLHKINIKITNISKISNFNINFIFPFIFKKNMNILYIRNKKHHYKKIKYYYRLDKRNKRFKKEKELLLRFPPKVYTLNMRFYKTSRKWGTYYYKKLLFRQLLLKIKNTLSSYLHKMVIYIPFYKRGNFPKLDNPKILSDYIKYLMKYENKNPNILKKIVSIHSVQRKKNIKRTYYLMRKLLHFYKNIHSKLFMYYNIKNTSSFINKIKVYSNIIKKKKIFNIYNNKKKKVNVFNFKIKNINLLNNYNSKNKYKINKNKNNTYKINFKKYNLFYNNSFYLNKKIKKKSNNSSLLLENKLKKLLIYNEKKLVKRKTNMKKYINSCNSINYYKKNKIKYNVNIYTKYKRINEIYNVPMLLNWKFKFRDLTYKKYPLIGMRIELNGPTKKGRRTQKHIYSEWVDFYRLPGTMPLVTIMNDIQYWQSYGLTFRAAIGIKLWMHFYPVMHSQTKKNLLYSR